MNLRKVLVLISVAFFSAVGDAMLARGMRDAGAIDIHHATHVFSSLANPFVISGILLLMGYMWCYMTALSFADLTYVLPATGLSYVIMALISIFWLHEHVSIQRWGGIALIVAGVGLVAGGPSRTEHPPGRGVAETRSPSPSPSRSEALEEKRR